MDPKGFIVQTTVDSQSVSEAIAKTTLDERLCGCVQISPGLKSFYHWEGKLVQSDEVRMVFKTTVEKISPLLKRIKELHPYDIPEIIAQRIDLMDEDYRAWLVLVTDSPELGESPLMPA